MVLFAIQHGGWCAAAPNMKGYRKYGNSNKCRNGKGGPWANDVYRITNPIRPTVPKGRYTTEEIVPNSPRAVLTYFKGTLYFSISK